MPIADYVVPRDHFKAEELSGLCFPCGCCVHSDKAADDHPCSECDHNVNADPEQEATQ